MNKLKPGDWFHCACSGGKCGVRGQVVKLLSDGMLHVVSNSADDPDRWESEVLNVYDVRAYHPSEDVVLSFMKFLTRGDIDGV
jgi:hypothetical protein